MLESDRTSSDSQPAGNAPHGCVWHLVDGHAVYGVPAAPWWRTTADILDSDRDVMMDELSYWWLR